MRETVREGGGGGLKSRDCQIHGNPEETVEAIQRKQAKLTNICRTYRPLNKRKKMPESLKPSRAKLYGAKTRGRDFTGGTVID